MIRVLVRAKTAIARAGLESLVRGDPRFELASSRQADIVRELRDLSPQVVLFDAADQDLARAVPNFLHEPSAPGFVLLVNEARRPEVRRALQAGVRGLLLRESSADEITSALVAVASGLAVVSPDLLDALFPGNGEPTPVEALGPVEPLSARESEILGLLADGGGNKEIATRLHISEHTVKFHVSAILAKLGATTRTEAVARGYREGLIVL